MPTPDSKNRVADAGRLRKKKSVGATGHYSNFVSHQLTSAFLAAHRLLATMGTGKKEATRRVRQGKVGDGLGNVKVKGENFYR